MSSGQDGAAGSGVANVGLEREYSGHTRLAGALPGLTACSPDGPPRPP